MTREELLAAMRATAQSARKPRKITIPEWGDIYIRDLLLSDVDLAEEIDGARKSDWRNTSEGIAERADNLGMSQGISESETDFANRIERQIAACRGFARLVCDENGNRLLDPDNDEDLALIAGQKFNTVTTVTSAPEGN